MTPETVQETIALVLSDEGGVEDVHDGKGVTSFGQTPGWLADNGFIPPSNAADAATNYEAWMKKTGLYELAQADHFAGYLLVDFAIHSGVTQAVTCLQRALGLKADGQLGPKTIAAYHSVAGQANLSKVILAERLGFIGGLLSSTKTDRRAWARGWCLRLARQIKQLP
jgi:lysozyme family protein